MSEQGSGAAGTERAQRPLAARRRARVPGPRDTRRGMKARARLAQGTAYCLRAINIIEAGGKRGRTPLHRRM
jgi:hypothetical protein